MAVVGSVDRLRLILGQLLFLRSGLQTSNTTLEADFSPVFGRACHNLAEDGIPSEGIVGRGESFIIPLDDVSLETDIEFAIVMFFEVVSASTLHQRYPLSSSQAQ